MRKSDIFFLFMGICVMLSGVAMLHSRISKADAVKVIEIQSKMVGDLELTDLCLFTEARYTRHPSQADLNTPFQDHPMSLEHFPTGSIVPPPAARLLQGS